MLKKEIVKMLYHENVEGVPIFRIAKSLGIRWETAQRLVEDLEKRGWVKIVEEKSFPFRKTVSLTNEGASFASELLSMERTALDPLDAILLVIIYAVGGKVEGATKLEKLPFLLEKEFGVKIDHLFKYFPYLHGPYSPKVIQTTHRLAYFKLINIEEKVVGTGINEEYVMRIYTLTPEGKKLAEEIFKKLPNDYQEALYGLKNFAEKPLRDLLRYVYTKYPEVKKYTTLDDFI
jgi:predicted transcriptional regulator